MPNDFHLYIVYRHINSTFVEEARLETDDSSLHSFGVSVSVSGNLVALGDRAYGDANEGAVFIYEYNALADAWNQNGIVINDDCDGLFGSSLAFTDDQGLIIGCSNELNRTGAVYYYVQSETYAGIKFVLKKQKISASEGDLFDDFGHAEQI